MENSNTLPQTQDPVTEPMVEAAARAMYDRCAEDLGLRCEDHWDECGESLKAPWRMFARVALIAGIAAALQEGR